MKVTVKLFAAARDLVGTPEVTFEVADAATVADLRDLLAEEYPAAAALVSRAMFAIDARYASDDDKLAGAKEIACIPPVSGG
jgi:molybdopterin synthase sulfur carrier subunit